MAQISKYVLSKNVYETMFDIFSAVITNLTEKNKVLGFFDEFFTHTEKIMLAKRLTIGVLIAKNYKYREIAEILRVSLSTIGSVAESYKYGSNFKRVVEKVLSDIEIEDFFSEVVESVAGVGSNVSKGSSGWVHLKRELSRKRLNKPF